MILVMVELLVQVSFIMMRQKTNFMALDIKMDFAYSKNLKQQLFPLLLVLMLHNRMKTHPLDFLGTENEGWRIIKNIELGPQIGESGKSAAKFKRISMEHYLHCIRTKITNGDFD